MKLPFSSALLQSWWHRLHWKTLFILSAAASGDSMGKSNMERRSVLCKLGLHKLGEVAEDYLKDACVYRGFNNRVYQKGVRKCSRDGCDFERKVWCYGWHLSELGQMNLCRWKKLNLYREAIIDAMPYYMLM